MSLATKPVKTAIIARLKTIIPRVYDTEDPELATSAVPYIVVYFGNPIRTGTDRGIVSVRNDPQRGFFTVQAVSSTSGSLNDLVDLIRDSLIGYTPPDCGELSPEGGTSYNNATPGVAPTRFYSDSGFSYLTNLSWN